MRQYFTLLTDLPLDEVERVLGPRSTRATPRRRWARRSLPSTHGAEAAERRRRWFRRRAKGEDPEEIPEVFCRAPAPPCSTANGSMPVGPANLRRSGSTSNSSNARARSSRAVFTSVTGRHSHHRPEGPSAGLRRIDRPGGEAENWADQIWVERQVCGLGLLVMSDRLIAVRWSTSLWSATAVPYGSLTHDRSSERLYR